MDRSNGSAANGNGRREIDLHRRVCVVTPDQVEIKPAKSAAIVPLIGMALGILAFVLVALWLERLPFPLALLLMGAAILLVPFSGMGFVFSVYGANVVIDRRKQSALWQQGLFGMGVGTEELVPFWKIERLEVDEVSSERQLGGPQDFAQFEISLIKTSGKRLSLGQVTVPREVAAEGLARARDAGEAVAALVEKPLKLPPEDKPQRRRWRRRSRPGKQAGV